MDEAVEQKARVLMVDDDPSCTDGFTARLRAAGYEVLEADSGQRALRLTRERKPDLVVLETALPDMSGLEVCRQIKAGIGMQDVFVVMFSGGGPGPAGKPGEPGTGADEYLQKTLTPDEFLARIRTILRLRDTTAALRASEQHYRRLIEILPDAVVSMDLEGRVTAANAQAVSMLGYEDPAELMSRDVFDLTEPGNHERVRERIERVLEAGILRNFEDTLVRKDGSTLPVEISVAVLKTDRGNPVELVAVMRDITERKRVEETLRTSEERFRQVAESIREVFWMTDLEKSRMIYISPGYEEVWGRSRAVLYGSPRDWLDAIHPEDRQRVLDAALTKQTSGQYDEVYRIVRPDGSIRWIQDRAFPVRDPSGKVKRVAGIAEDITKRKLAEQRLAVQHAAVRGLAESATLGEASSKMLRAVCEELGWELGAIWEVDKGANVLRCVDLWCSAPAQFRQFVELTRSRGYARGEGLTGRIWQLAEPVWIRDSLADPGFIRGPIAARSGLHGAFGFPILLGEEVIGVIEFFSREIREPDQALLDMMRALGGQVGQFIGRKQAEEALRQAEGKYRSIFENAVEGIFQTTPEGKYLSANPALARMLGYESPEELMACLTDIGSQLCVDPASRLELKRRIEAEGFVRNFENQVYCKDSSIKWVSINARLVRDAGGKILYYEGTNQDITERKRAEFQVATLAHAVQCTAELISITDVRDRFIFVNRAFREAHGYSEEEILGRTPEILHSPKNPKSLTAEILESTRRGGWRGEVLDLRKDGREFPVLLSTSLVKDSSGQVLGLMGVAQDISERKRAEDQIRLLADAVESTREFICITDLENRFTFINRAFMAAYGYSKREILGRKPDLLHSPKNPPGLGDHILQQTLAGGWEGELVNRKKDGTEFQIALTTFQIKTTDGRILGLAGVGRDISERKRVEKQTAAFSELGYRLSSTLTAEEASRIILDIASELFGWDSGYVHLYSRAEDRIIPILTMDTIKGRRTSIEATTFTLDPSPLMRRVMGEGARLINRGDESPGMGLLPFGDKTRPSEARMYAPIHAGASVVGILSIQSYTAQAYSQDDLKLLQTLADYCGAALQRIHVEAALRELAAIVESSDDAIISQGVDGRIVSWNKAAERIYGYSGAEAVGRPISMLIPPEAAGEFRKSAGSLERGERTVHLETRWRRKDGGLVDASLTFSPIRDNGGVVKGTSIIARDITQRKRLEKAVLEVSDREQLRIGQDIHDSLCQQLFSTAMACNLLREDLASRGLKEAVAAGRILEQINAAVSEARTLARGLSASNLIRDGLAVTLEELAATASKDFHVACVLECPEPVPTGDPAVADHLYRIAREAVHNAGKHAKAERIVIRLAIEGETGCLSISDDGFGIKESKGNGMGMGLDIMRYRATMIGGELKIQRKGSRGTLIACYFPRKALGYSTLTHEVVGSTKQKNPGISSG